MPKFRNRIIIEAEQFWPDRRPYPKGVTARECGDWVLDGVILIAPGDWIIACEDGRSYPCKPDIFERTYKLVEDGIICPRCGKRSETVRQRACCGYCMCDDCEPEHAWTDDGEED